VHWVSGVRKVWGTKKKGSCNEVVEEVDRMVGKMTSKFSVWRHVGLVNGGIVWCFVVKAQER